MLIKRLAAVIRVTVACVAFVTAYVAIAFRIEFEQQRAEYTRVIKSIGEVAQLMHDNSDVMLRYKHYTQYHFDRKHNHCLECNQYPLPAGWGSKRPAPLLRDSEWLDTWNNPYIHRDIIEVHRGIHSLIMQLRVQNVSLRHTLYAMRESTGYKSRQDK